MVTGIDLRDEGKRADRLKPLTDMLASKFSAVIEVQTIFSCMVQCNAKKEYFGTTSFPKTEFVASSIIKPSQPSYFSELVERVLGAVTASGTVSVEKVLEVTRKMYLESRLTADLPAPEVHKYSTKHNLNLESLFKTRKYGGGTGPELDENGGNQSLLRLINECTLNLVPFYLDQQVLRSVVCRANKTEPRWLLEDFLASTPDKVSTLDCGLPVFFSSSFFLYCSVTDTLFFFSLSHTKDKYEVCETRFVAKLGEHVIHGDFLWKHEYFERIARAFSRALQKSEQELLSVLLKGCVTNYHSASALLNGAVQTPVAKIAKVAVISSTPVRGGGWLAADDDE
jgi:hypothetical protein